MERKSVQKVKNILKDINHSSKVIELKNTARSAQDAAIALDVSVGAIVKTLVFLIVDQEKSIPVITLIAGDKQCRTKIIPKLLNVNGKIIRPDAKTVKEISGYSIGGVSPVGLPRGIHVIMDNSLKRFEQIWSAAGHSHCVFSSTFEELRKITNPILSDEIS